MRLSLSILITLFVMAPYLVHANCIPLDISLEKRVDFADHIILGKILEERNLPRSVKGMDREVLIAVDRVFKGSIKINDSISLFAKNADNDDCDPYTLPVLTQPSDIEPKFLFYVKEIEGVNFISRGQGVKYMGHSLTRDEVKELSAMNFGTGKYFSWKWVKSAILSTLEVCFGKDNSK